MRTYNSSSYIITNNVALNRNRIKDCQTRSVEFKTKIRIIDKCQSATQIQL